MAGSLEAIYVETNENPTHAVIWLHGLGADGNDFKGVVPSLGLDNASVRFVFPHAPIRPVTINGGMEMRAWYDILEMDLDRKVDMANIDESCEQISALVEEQIAQGITSDKIIIAGFSQGGVIAYQMALTSKHKFAGVMALSTYLADFESVPEANTVANHTTPFLIHHGSYDPVVEPTLGARAKAILTDKGFDTSYQSYPMPHSVCPAQIGDISAWLKGVIE
ncbi:alpha/beta hydrolase [Marinomonas balearica]|uniref:Phospholipase/carboxylesterase n=1 Tax=Marinomonas balearica TaxID=491947 RepID=A0A4R6M3Y7_9GAMM|nr:dienelactone hydrolase family protein [Marinomonas balearica]TDO96017.1 phospholipase/carboxylesterase [Marinomonas balearica]